MTPQEIHTDYVRRTVRAHIENNPRPRYLVIRGTRAVEKPSFLLVPSILAIVIILVVAGLSVVAR